MNILFVLLLSIPHQDGYWIYAILFLIIYFIPSIVGWNKKQSTSIKILNLFLGWTIIGWLAALIWAATSPLIPKYSYICSKCGYIHRLDQEVKLFVCPQCKTETPQ